MKLKTLIYSDGNLSAYFAEGVFRETATLRLDSKSPAEVLEARDALLTWLAAQLPEGFGEITHVVVDVLPDDVVEGEEGPATWPAFSIAVSGKSERGLATTSIRSSPGRETTLLSQTLNRLFAS